MKFINGWKITINALFQLWEDIGILNALYVLAV